MNEPNGAGVLGSRSRYHIDDSGVAGWVKPWRRDGNNIRVLRDASPQVGQRCTRLRAVGNRGREDQRSDCAGTEVAREDVVAHARFRALWVIARVAVADADCEQRNRQNDEDDKRGDAGHGRSTLDRLAPSPRPGPFRAHRPPLPMHRQAVDARTERTQQCRQQCQRGGHDEQDGSDRADGSARDVGQADDEQPE